MQTKTVGRSQMRKKRPEKLKAAFHGICDMLPFPVERGAGSL
ncbi:hypothetical protein HMPREF3038_01087 [Akkermansia sp. KLE1797]|nr:hypothetical protein HMPREF3038_01087 [Akkermansia sp. KLE1797]KXU53268.1 hypothetical protein HMPREF3039_02450 [Akkermansia sp. KLE1798]